MTTTTTPSPDPTLTKANTVANANTAKLLKATEDITKVIEALKHSTTLHSDLTQEIAEKEAALASLEVRFQEKSRQLQVAMDLDFKEREMEKVNQILAKQGKQATSSADHELLVTEFAALKRDFAQKLEEETAKVRQHETAKAATAIKQAQLEMQVKEAANTASITSLTDKNSLLQSQVEDYKTQLVAERDARVKEAQARGASQITVNGGK